MNYVGKAAVASVLALSTVVSPVIESETMAKAATKAQLSTSNFMIYVGDSFKLQLFNAKAKSFKSSSTKVVKVSKTGKVTGKNPGTATVTVTDKSGKKYTCKVTVVKKGSANKNDDTKKPVDTSGSDIDLGGMTIYIRNWWSRGRVGEPEEPYMATSVYQESQRAYQEEMMQKYNFKIYEVGEDDWGQINNHFIDYTLSGGDKNNYIWTLRADYTTGNAIRDGLMADLSKIDCLDFSQDKFKRNKVHEKYSLGSSIYAFFPGYSEPRTGVYFNKNVLKNAGIDPNDIYDAQKNGTWDWKMFEDLMAKCQKDLDHDGVDDVYGLTTNESVMIDAAVLSNGGSYIKKEKGKLVYGVEDATTLEALNWCVDVFTKFDDHTPDDAIWDYYMNEWRSGKTAFLVDMEYTNTPGNVFSNTDFEVGFVMFPKGPKASNYVSEFENNFYVIPACYVGKDKDKQGHDRAWRIAFAWNVYTNPVPGYEDYNEYLERAKNGNFDERALKETIPMMSNPKNGVVSYYNLVSDIYENLGKDLTWNIVPYGDVAATVEGLRDRWKKAIAEANK